MSRTEPNTVCARPSLWKPCCCRLHWSTVTAAVCCLNVTHCSRWRGTDQMTDRLLWNHYEVWSRINSQSQRCLSLAEVTHSRGRLYFSVQSCHSRWGVADVSEALQPWDVYPEVHGNKEIRRLIVLFYALVFDWFVIKSLKLTLLNLCHRCS